MFETWKFSKPQRMVSKKKTMVLEGGWGEGVNVKVKCLKKNTLVAKKWVVKLREFFTVFFEFQTSFQKKVIVINLLCVKCDGNTRAVESVL